MKSLRFRSFMMKPMTEADPPKPVTVLPPCGCTTTNSFVVVKDRSGQVRWLQECFKHWR